MRTKKLIAGLVAAMTLTSVSASAIVTAADDFTASISKAEAAAGESFELTLDLTNIPETGLNACNFGISYDSSLVTIDEVTLGSLAKDVSSVEVSPSGEKLPDPFMFNIGTDAINIAYTLGAVESAYFLSGSGTFLNIAGTVNDDAAAGSDAAFKIVPVDRAADAGSSVTNTDAVFGYLSTEEVPTNYTPVFTDGNVHVLGGSSVETTEPETTEAVTENIADGTKYGDVNLDNDVSIADVVKINTYLLNKEGNPLTAEAKANADCVRDNQITVADSGLIMNYTAMVVDISELGKK